MPISPTLRGGLLSILGQFPCIARGWGSGGGAIDRCIINVIIIMCGIVGARMNYNSLAENLLILVIYIYNSSLFMQNSTVRNLLELYRKRVNNLLRQDLYIIINT